MLPLVIASLLETHRGCALHFVKIAGSMFWQVLAFLDVSIYPTVSAYFVDVRAKSGPRSLVTHTCVHIRCLARRRI